MSRPSFRPRPIDLTKPLPIINTSKDLRHEDDVVVNRALPTIATGVDPAEEEERHLQQALLASVFGDARNAAVADIPVPVVARVTPPDMPGVFARPSHYIMFDRSDADLEEACVEYDADHVDAAFADRAALIRPKFPVPLDVFERSMDALEKLQGRSDAPTTLVTYGTVKHALASLLPDHPDAARRDLYQHWHTRRSQLATPFLRMYQIAPDPNNQNPAIAFRPRDRDAAAGSARRMNTYDNYRRARLLREELVTLRTLLTRVADREANKRSLLAIHLLRQRIAVTAASGSRLDAVTRAIFPADAEPVVVYGPSSCQALVPARGLRLPDSVPVVNRRLGTPTDRPAKKARRKSTSKAADKARARDPFTSDRSAIPAGVDTFGFDEHGNRFLKHMRYFAGGFMNYGVSPYDHRVFAAASERNTVRDLPRSPKPITFPGNVGFGRLPDTGRARGAKIGPSVLNTAEVASDILGKRSFQQFAPFTPAPSSPRSVRGSVRARARVGRGGRIILDRVIFERERGVKAASYPASVEMGGVYTAGLPLDASTRVASVVSRGALGEVRKLQAINPDGCANVPEDSMGMLAGKLIPPLKAVVQFAVGTGAARDVVDFWPRRKRGRGKVGPGERAGLRTTVDNVGVEVVSEDERRHLPAYAPRESPLVSEL